MSDHSILFSGIPASSVAYPSRSTQAKLFLDKEDGVLKILSYDGTIKPLIRDDVALIGEVSQEKLDELHDKIRAINDLLKELVTSKELESLSESLIQQMKSLNAASYTSLESHSDAQDEATRRMLDSSVELLNGRIDQFFDIVTKLNTLLGSRLTKDEVSYLIAKAIADLPPQVTISSGSSNVHVDRNNNHYIISVDVPEITKEVTKQVVSSGSGGGMTKSAVQKLIDASATTITSTGGTITVTQTGTHSINLEVTGVPPVIVPLAISSFTGGGTYEFGQSISGASLEWSYNYAPDTSQSLNQGIGSVDLSATSYVYSTPMSADTTFTLSAVDSLHGSASANTSVSFINRRYVGVFAADSVLTDSDVTALDSELSDSRVASFVNYGCSGSRFVFAYPSRLGLATVKDGNNNIYQDWYDGDDEGSTTPYTVNVTNSFGYTEEYYCYQSTNRYFGSPTFIFG